MAEEILASVQVRRDNKANWEAVNPILLDGEAAYEKDTDMFKIGDGVKRYSDLPYHNKIGPKGDTGSSGVYIGTSQPTDSNINVWIDSDGEPTEVIDDFAREEIGRLKSEIPTALPNPQPLTINGQRYDGSKAVTVTTVEIDDTLTQSGKAADAKAVGDQLSALNEANAKQDSDLGELKKGYSNIRFDMEHGFINANGVDTDSNSSYRSIGFIHNTAKTQMIKFFCNNRILIRCYESDETFKKTFEVAEGVISTINIPYPLLRITLPYDGKDVDVSSLIVTYAIDNEFFVYPEQFGAIGDGETDDTVALQKCIDFAQVHKLNVNMQKKTYAITRVNITDYLCIDANNCTIKALANASPVKVDKKYNSPSGYIKNLIIDMNHIATGGLYIVEDWRRNYENITFYNIAPNESYESVALNYVNGGGCFFDKIRGYQESGNIFDAIFINCSGNDSTFSHCDYERYKYGMNITGENLVDNFHGFIDENEMYEGSYFMRVAGGVICNQVYPDTQQYGFLCRSTTGLIINGMKFYFNNVMVDYQNIPKGYVFYCDLTGQEKLNRFKAVKLCGSYIIETEDQGKNINYAFCNSDGGDYDSGGISVLNTVFHGIPDVS